MKTIRQYFQEALDKPYDYEHLGSHDYEDGESEHHYGFKDRNGVPTHVYITHAEKDKEGRQKAYVNFTDAFGDIEATGKGSIRHLSTVKKIMQDHAKKHPHLKHYEFTSEKDSDKPGGGGRSRLYAALAKRAGGHSEEGNSYQSKHYVPINRGPKTIAQIREEYLMEKWLLSPDEGVPHLEHAHHPQEESASEATEHAIASKIDMHKRMRGEKGDDRFTHSGKVDDKMSVKVYKDNKGKIFVGYKGPSAPLLSSEEEIASTYKDKPYIANALTHLLKHVGKMIPENERGVRYQMGLVHSGDSDAILKRGEDGSVTPNTITYKYKKPKPGAKLGASVIMKTQHDEEGVPTSHSQNIDLDKMGSHPDIEVLDNRIDFSQATPHYDEKAQAGFQRHIGAAQSIHDRMKEDGHYDAINGHAAHIQRYLNSLEKAGLEKPRPSRENVRQYRDFLRGIGQAEAAKVKKEETKQKKLSQYEEMALRVENNPKAFLNAFRLQHHIRQAGRHQEPALSKASFADVEQTIDGNPVEGEGVVSSSAHSNGALAMHKHVPQTFTRSNFEKSERFKKRAEPDDEKHAHVFYGKVQYATLGHRSGVNQMQQAAEEDRKQGRNVSTVIGLSNTGGPLGVEGKKEHAESIFSHPVETGQAHTSNLFSFLEDLYKRGHTHVTIHAGSDRAGDYQAILDRYNGKPDKKGNVLFNFKSAKVKQIGGDRDEGELTKHPEEMSEKELTSTAKASRMREYARKGDESSRRAFFAYHRPLGLSDDVVQGHWNKLKTAMAAQQETPPVAVKKPKAKVQVAGPKIPAGLEHYGFGRYGRVDAKTGKRTVTHYMKNGKLVPKMKKTGT